MTCDAIVVGSGPNGLAAAIELARAGRSVRVLEARDRIGGGTRSAELTLAGFIHDVCSAIHPLAAKSPFFSRLPLSDYGLGWIYPPAALAHPFDDGTVALLEHSVVKTSRTIGRDGPAYQKLMTPLVQDWEELAGEILGPLRLPRHPIILGRFGLRAVRSARGLAESVFEGEPARALFAGLAAHSMMPLEKSPTAAFALTLGALAHVAGWPVARGGSQKIADALATYLGSLGGVVTTDHPVESIDQLPNAQLIFFDITPRQMLRIAGRRLPAGYQRRLQRYRHGPGVFKVDWALSHAIPWKASECQRAGTVHVGGTLAEIAAAERQVWTGEHPARPFVLVAQQSLFDPTRAPQGKHTGWAYCHVPNGSTVDMAQRIEDQIERFAPGFRDCILARNVMSPLRLEQYNHNYIGGDIGGGVQDLRQLFARPVAKLVPYSIPVDGWYICSSSTPPGAGVHGMCGYHAARAALSRSR